MRKTLLACALVFALSASAHAGWIQYGVAPPPPPPPSAPAQGDVDSGLIQITLTLLSLF